VHPLGTSAVTYVIQRAESLATLLLLVTVSAVVAGISAANAVRCSGLLPVVVILALLAGKSESGNVDAHGFQVYYTGEIARASNMTVTISLDEQSVRIEAKPADS
jgi:hypothetical protein